MQIAQTMNTEINNLYFEDFESGQCLNSKGHTIERDELINFAKIWDPMPFHIDDVAGIKAFGSITAPGLYTLAIKQRLIHTLPTLQVIASLGYDELQFKEPMRPDDTVSLRMESVSARVSSSKPDRGIVCLRLTLLNQDDKVVMTQLDTVLMRRRLHSENK